ncbi:SMI1/KNR4 family protein [Undibacterium sp.]|uniref:SMI1/KNR4 family protein n=1 Tax=Undibacterium sp. TaxID=1914977 RepID=UPI00374D9098
MLQPLNDIKQIFADKNVLQFMQFNPGATAEELQEFEQHLGVTLPADFKECLAEFNGQADTPGMFIGSALLSIDEIKLQWDMLYEVGKDGSLNEDFADSMTAVPEGYVKPMYVNPKWIPFTHDSGGNYLGIDLDPDVNGTVGQVIIFGRDEQEKVFVAPSFTAFLTLVRDQLRTIKWSVKEHEWDIQDKKYNLHYHDLLRTLLHETDPRYPE